MRRLTIAIALWASPALAQGPAEPAPAEPDAPTDEAPAVVGERTLVDDLDEDQPLEVGAQLRIFRQARRRKAEIERMEGELQRRAARLAEIEAEIASRYKTLRLIQEELVATDAADPNAGVEPAELQRREAAERAARADEVKKLSKVVDKMKPAEAAKMLSVMHEPLVVDVMLLVKSKVAARILGEMDPEQAARIGEQMARIRKQRQSGGR